MEFYANPRVRVSSDARNAPACGQPLGPKMYRSFPSSETGDYVKPEDELMSFK
jgi:hypothetical protein